MSTSVVSDQATSTNSPLDIFMATKHPASMTGAKVGDNIDIILKAAGVAPPKRDGPERDLYIGCSAMDINKKVFGEYADISAKVYSWVTRKDAPPNVLFHWALIVGDYVHELSYDDHYYNFYENKPFVPTAKRGDKDYYRLYRLGTTKFNDAAIVEEGVKAIAEPLMLPRYDVRLNNCQKFVVELVKLICVPGRKMVTTTYGWSEQAAAEPIVMRMHKAIMIPDGATEEEIQALKAKAREEEEEEYQAELAKLEKKKAEKQNAAKEAAMEDLVADIEGLMAAGEVEGQFPDPATNTRISEVVFLESVEDSKEAEPESKV